MRPVIAINGIIQPTKAISGAKRLEYRSQSHYAQQTTDPAEVIEGENGGNGDHWEDVDEPMDLDSIMTGHDELPSSHAGGELFELLAHELRKERSKGSQDTRDRSDRINKRNKGFADQLEDMVDSYLHWSFTTASKGLWSIEIETTGVVQAHYDIIVVDIVGEQTQSIPLIEGDKGIAAALLHSGLIPCAPFSPQLAVTIRTMEIYRALSLGCPRMSIQNFVKSLCYMYKKPYISHMNKQLSICNDVYLQILGAVEYRLQVVLKRDMPFWRLKHICPPCTYAMMDEKELEISMLVTIDGNNSLKRIPKSGRLDSFEDENGQVQLLSQISDLRDSRIAHGDYYIPREDVQKWADELKNRLPENPADVRQNGKKKAQELIQQVEEEDNTPCSERWKNMSEQRTARTLQIFDETGVFVALCRHGFVLTLTDMVKSGEGSQYALAVVEQLLKTFGSGLGVGYDIGCRFIKTLLQSSLGPLVLEKKYKSLVGSFHGHAHNHLCQLDYLAIYVKGLGLSDLEGAERLFSRTNELAASTRHSSAFHRQQHIVQYLQYLNKIDTYKGLSKMLIGNYKRALDILANAPVYERTRAELNIGASFDFSTWLHEEKAYLTSRLKEPPEDTFEIEYVQRLMKLQDVREKLNSSQQWFIETPVLVSTMTASETARKERERRHLKEIESMEQKRVHELEVKLGITMSWKEDDDGWKRAIDKKVHREYRLSLDKLERLVVQRLFELGDTNCLGTGYRMRQHISFAIQTRSKAIRSAIQHYNIAAKNLSPPRDELRWEQVVDYAFLSEFDTLSNSRVDIREKEWTRPASRRLMDLYFKMQRAQEEVKCLNIEIPQLITYMHDEETFLSSMEAQFSQTNPLISHQIHLCRIRFELANKRHRTTLQEFITKHNLDISLIPGTADNHISGDASVRSIVHDPINTTVDPINEWTREFQIEEDEDTMEQQLLHDLEIIMSASNDNHTED